MDNDRIHRFTNTGISINDFGKTDGDSSPFNLKREFRVKMRFEAFVNIYKTGEVTKHVHRRAADLSAKIKERSNIYERIACLSISGEYEIGEGLDNE